MQNYNLLNIKKLTHFSLLKAKNYKVGLPWLDIDLTIANEVGPLTDMEVVKKLLAIAKRENYCLVHLFTGQWMKYQNNEESVIHGLSDTSPSGHVFGRNNVGATSIFDCGPDPWKVACMSTFSHELAHSMGAAHDGVDESRHLESNLMPAYNDMETPLSANNLKLSSASMGNITRFLKEKYQLFVKSECKL